MEQDSLLHLAEKTGPSGYVVGVDPDKERIKIAEDSYKKTGELEVRSE